MGPWLRTVIPSTVAALALVAPGAQALAAPVAPTTSVNATFGA